MAMNFVIKVSLMISLTQMMAYAICPNGLDISPCHCVNNKEINCSSKQHYELKTIFQILNKKLDNSQSHVFDLLHVKDYIYDLPEDVFGKVSFKHIEFVDSILSTVHSNAFSATNRLTQKISLSNTSIDNRGAKERDFFDALSKFIGLQTLYITDNKMTAVPEHAFKPLIGTQQSLKWISFSNNDITHMGDNAFYDLPSLEDLILSNNRIASISDHTFAFAKTSINHLDLDLRNNLLDSSSFEKNWYSRSLRPINLHLGGNRMTYLSESIFSAFLNRNINNTISIEQNPIYCDCRSKWLIGDKHFYKNKVFGMTCQNKKNIFDYTIDDFDHCVDEFVNL